MGAAEEPHWPVSSVTRPIARQFSALLWASIVESEWEWRFMKPGQTSNPFASMTFSAPFKGSGVTLAIFPSLTPMSALNHGFPVPSIILPFLITISKSVSTTYAPFDCMHI